ncbi:MAG TPA: FAD-dependent oxidoreductase [Bryobacteraceae bacterium]|nr:FAD-dependent oxidoreductase [Bryobacteraceae bacterium]
MEPMETSCCIVGGGPAGMMLGYLLARQGVDVIVIEKHKDFLRDFRGDTVHPSTLQVMYELGLLERFLALPHQKVTSANAMIGGETFHFADFTHVPTHCKYIALMPQWDLLDFLAQQGGRYPGFHVLMEHEATGVVRGADGAVKGVEMRTCVNGVEQPGRIQASLTVACDGRRSTVRAAAGLKPVERGVPIDVVWFRIRRKEDDHGEFFGIVNFGEALVLINRRDYFQAGLIVPKGSFDEIKSKGLDEFRQTIARLAPFLADRTGEIASWKDVSLLSVQIDRLPRWYERGLLCIGDAAHAMSPVGGVGINLAIQDAVATANLLGPALLADNVTIAHLASVQSRREFPAKVIQAAQARAHRVLAATFSAKQQMKAPWPLKIITRIPGVQRVMGFVVGVGVRPEHVAGTRKSESNVAVIVAGCAAGLAAFIWVWRRGGHTARP